jgi:hypothetical protein
VSEGILQLNQTVANADLVPPSTESSPRDWRSTPKYTPKACQSLEETGVSATSQPRPLGRGIADTFHHSRWPTIRGPTAREG